MEGKKKCPILVENPEEADVVRMIFDMYVNQDMGCTNICYKLDELGIKPESHPERLIKDAVWGMMPHGRLGRAQFAKLKVYAGAEHPHTAQKPVKVNLEK